MDLNAKMIKVRNKIIRKAKQGLKREMLSFQMKCCQKFVKTLVIVLAIG